MKTDRKTLWYLNRIEKFIFIILRLICLLHIRNLTYIIFMSMVFQFQSKSKFAPQFIYVSTIQLSSYLIWFCCGILVHLTSKDWKFCLHLCLDNLAKLSPAHHPSGIYSSVPQGRLGEKYWYILWTWGRILEPKGNMPNLS